MEFGRQAADVIRTSNLSAVDGTNEDVTSLALPDGRSSVSHQGTTILNARPERSLGMLVRINDFIIYVPTDTPVTIVASEPKPDSQGDQSHWEDELQQMLDDYD